MLPYFTFRLILFLTRIIQLAMSCLILFQKQLGMFRTNAQRLSHPTVVSYPHTTNESQPDKDERKKKVI